MVVREDAGDDDDDGQDDAEVEVVVGRIFQFSRLESIGDEAQDGSGPEEKREPAKELPPIL